MKTVIPVDDSDVLKATRRFLRSLMEAGVVEALYVPLETEGGAVLPALVTDPAMLERANPLAPVMPINGARAVSALTGKHTPGTLGAVLRPCEIRALVELVKLQQANLEGLTLIGIDCAGTFEVRDFTARRKAGNLDWAGYLSGLKGGMATVDGLPLRAACQMCVTPVAENCAIHLELLGSDLASGIPLTVADELAARLGLSETPRGEGAAALLVVRDSGPGIAEADRARALEPFTQLDPSRGTKGNVGLGLAIVQAIAKAHGGRLELATGASGGLEARIFLHSV